jgi:hypothetical protein
MTRWRNRIGEEGVEWLLTETIKAGQRAGAVKARSQAGHRRYHGDGKEHRPPDGCPALRDGTAQVGRAGVRGRDRPAAELQPPRAPGLADRSGAMLMPGNSSGCARRCAVSRAIPGACCATSSGRWTRFVDGPLKSQLQDLIALVNRLLAQKPKDKKKLYSLHEPAVDCISKGKAHKRYEFGTKVSVATTTEGGFVVGMRALPGNPYDGHTLTRGAGAGGNPDRSAPGDGLRRPWLPGPWRRKCKGLHQRRPARRHQNHRKAAATTQRHRANDRPHEKRWPPDAMPTQGNRLATHCSPCSAAAVTTSA